MEFGKIFAIVNRDFELLHVYMLNSVDLIFKVLIDSHLTHRRTVSTRYSHMEQNSNSD